MRELPVFADPANLVEPEEERELLELAEDETSLDFLQKIYRSPKQPIARRMRAAIEAAPYERPKLTAVATASMNGNDFAAMLERAIARSQAPLKQIELKANETVAGVAWTGRPGASHEG
jgi:hypothetical protein